MKKNVLSVLFLILGLALGSIAIASASSAIVELKPLPDNYLESEIPGMVAAIGQNGKKGYITLKDSESPYTPEGIIVPVYDKDCKTVIDSFLIGGPDVYIMYGDNEGNGFVEFAGNKVPIDEFDDYCKENNIEPPRSLGNIPDLTERAKQ